MFNVQNARNSLLENIYGPQYEILRKKGENSVQSEQN